MQRLFSEPLFFIFFVYGIAFLLLGYLVAKGARGSQSIPLIASFNMLALFGFAHGITELTDWVRFIRRTLGAPESGALTLLSQACLVVSFVLLLQFAVNLLTAQWLSRTAAVVRFVPVVALVVFAGVMAISGTTDVVAIGLRGRYTFGFVSAALAAVALLLTARTLRELDDDGLTLGLYVAAAGFAAYAVFGGLVVNPIAGVPIQLYRAVCAVTIALSCFSLIRLSTAVASGAAVEAFDPA